MGNIGGAQYAQLAHGLEPHVFALVGDVGPWATLGIGPVDDLVIDIGDIGNKPHLKAPIREVTTQNVVHQSGPAVTQMGWSIHSGTTEIDTDLARLAQCQWFHALSGGVVEVQHSYQPTI